MTKPFKLYSIDLLPKGFTYPPVVWQFASTGEYPDIYPWWFVDASTRAGALFYATRQSDGRNLIPFAKVDDGRDDVACFDGNDTSGNPSVLMLISDDSGRSYSYKDFGEWLQAAQSDATRWQG